MKLFLRVAATLASVGATGVLAAVGCATAVDDTTVQPYTDVYVDPQSFLSGSTAAGPPPLCAAGEGSLGTYVTTLQDVTFDPAAGWPPPVGVVSDLPSSPPIRCSLQSAFGQVIPGHLYIGEVEGYTEDVCATGQTGSGCILPIGGLNSGARTMVDGNGAIVAPRWKTTCGVSTHRQPDGGAPIAHIVDQPTIAQTEIEAALAGCGPLVPTSTAAVDSYVIVRTAALASQFGCDPDGGVGTIQGTVRAGGQTESTSVTVVNGNCQASDLQFGPFPAGTRVDVDINALLAGTNDPAVGATCTGYAVEGSSVSIPCGALTTQATLRIDVTALALAKGISCADLTTATATFAAAGDSGRSASGTCSSDILFTGVTAGVYALQVQLFTATDAGVGDGGAPAMTVAATSACTATISAGTQSTAVCN